ncbi:MAG: type II secretion system protein [Candidatus Omnitrophota bacterium]
MRDAGLRIKAPGKGFTLVELMVSVAILGIGLTVVANSYIAALKGINSASNIIGALNLGREKLEALEIFSLTNGLFISDSKAILQTPGKNYNYTQQVSEITESETLAKYLLQVCLNLSWQEQNATKNVIFSTYLSKQKQ